MNNLIVILNQSVPEGRVFGLDVQTLTDIGIQLFNAAILAVILAYLLYNPVKEFMQARRAKIEGQIEDADNTMTEAQELIIEYEKKLAGIEEERIEILESARQSANKEREAIRRDLDKEVEAIRSRAHQSAEAERKRLQEEARVYIIDNANLIAEKFIQEKITAEDHERLIDDAIGQLEESSW